MIDITIKTFTAVRKQEFPDDTVETLPGYEIRAVTIFASHTEVITRFVGFTGRVSELEQLRIIGTAIQQIGVEISRLADKKF